MRFLLFLFAALTVPASLQAQCRMGSGPDHGDGIPYCDTPPETEAPGPPPAPPPSWQDFAAAVVWADSDEGDQFVGVSKYVDEQMAVEAALQKCHRKPQWRNCSLAMSATNGVIAVGRDSQGKLRVRRSTSTADAHNGLLIKCAQEQVQCRILATFDGMAEYF